MRSLILLKQPSFFSKKYIFNIDIYNFSSLSFINANTLYILMELIKCVEDQLIDLLHIDCVCIKKILVTQDNLKKRLERENLLISCV